MITAHLTSESDPKLKQLKLKVKQNRPPLKSNGHDEISKTWQNMHVI